MTTPPPSRRSRRGFSRSAYELRLAYDLAVCDWLLRRPPGVCGIAEIPFESVPVLASFPHGRASDELGHGDPPGRGSMMAALDEAGAQVNLPPMAGFDEAGSQVSLPPMAGFDEAGAQVSLPPMAGFDEAGRGALAGPVTVACVSFDWGSLLRCEEATDLLFDVDDSKRLSAAKREQLYEQITKRAAWGVGCASAVEIDRLGIVASCRLAADRAYRRLDREIAAAVFDRGLSLTDPDRLVGATATRADARSFHVAAASIVAKVWRDRVMSGLDCSFGGYGLARHKGYGTAGHREAIVARGPTAIHRRSFLKGLERTETQSC